MNKHCILAKLVALSLLVSVVFVTAQPTAADVGQCASFNSSNSTVHIPCLKLGATSYYLDLSLVSSGLQLTTFGDNGIPGSASRCASFDIPSSTLHVPCLSVFGSDYWLDMPLISTSPILFGISKYGKNAFSQADLTGTWDFITFGAGMNGGWDHGLLTVDGAGSGTLTDYLGSDGSTDGGTPGCFALSISGTGSVTIGGPCGDDTIQASMSPDKTLIVGTSMLNETSAQLLVFRKRVAGVTYSSTDIANSQYAIQALLTGGISASVYGAGQTDGSGKMSFMALNSPSGPVTPLPASFTMQINSNGIITSASLSTFYGIMTADKKVLFTIDTFNTAPTYRLAAFLLTGQTFTTADLVGTYKFYTLISGATGTWQNGTFSVDAGGTQLYQSFLDSNGSTTLPASDILSINAGGQMTRAGNSAWHGQMSFNKDLYVRTAGTGLAIGFKQ